MLFRSGINSYSDLLEYYPYKYVDRSKVFHISTYKGYIVKVFPSEAAMNADPLGVPDELRDDRKAPAPVSK